VISLKNIKFKPTLTLTGGKTKGNIDNGLVLLSLIEMQNYNAPVIVSGDGFTTVWLSILI